jgi:hypothetical protein
VDLVKLCWWIGLLSMGCSFIPMNIVLTRLKNAGSGPGPFHSWRPLLDFPSQASEYLKIRNRFGWSAVPVYLFWTMIALGPIFIVIGAVLNHD